MVQLLAITDYIDSLAEAEARFGLSRNDEPSFFTEWSIDLPELTPSEQQRLDLIKQRYLNGAYSMFVKLDRSQYSFSEDFSLNRQRNQLYDVLRILNRLKSSDGVRSHLFYITV
jgi:hypothetical protein